MLIEIDKFGRAIAIGGCVAALLFTGLAAAKKGGNTNSGGNPEKVCVGDQKIEGGKMHTFNSGDGEQITEVCIKAGQQKPTFACGEYDDSGCYTIDWGDNCETVEISGGGTSRSCKDISHTTAIFGPGEEPPACTKTEEPEFSCTDQVDNDCDTFVDEDDPDCVPR